MKIDFGFSGRLNLQISVVCCAINHLSVFCLYPLPCQSGSSVWSCGHPGRGKSPQ